MLRKICLFFLLSHGLFATANGQVQYERPPIDYLNAEVNDAVTGLTRKLQDGEIKLEYDSEFGYLPAVLKALEVPISSQTLVFSKTSLQLQRISPRMPRALYFNDNVYVGYCQNGEVLEIAATDARQGATFYTLKQELVDAPGFVRDRGSCLTCHATSKTQNVPGYLIRSVFANASGRPAYGSGTFNTTYKSKFKDRWGGWYVSGTHGSMRHMGNVICDQDGKIDRDAGANDTDLTDNFRTAAYLSPHSDIVALMVLEHQTQMHNAITAANYETRAALHQSFTMNEILERPKDFVSDSAKRRIDKAANRVLEHLLFFEEFPLQAKVVGTTSFANDFAARGNRDSKGRSLRDFDLERRLFKYPCSYLIHSDAFAGLPDSVRLLVLFKLEKHPRGKEGRWPGRSERGERQRDPGDTTRNLAGNGIARTTFLHCF